MSVGPSPVAADHRLCVSRESCCAVPVARAPLPICPECGRRTRAVETHTVRHHALPHLVGTLSPGQYGFCDTPTCPVVYAVEGGPPLRKSDLRTRVGIKETEEPLPVCYCWSFTERQIVEDVLEHSHSSIRDSINRKVAEGTCACEYNNPSGRCCLGNVGAAIKKAERSAPSRAPAAAR